ncbi:hypothetical protein BU15DRAFT_62289 [Melanogaster broomeanus]|nr:hypothetical protein BU15DRAFT_62289 [Melanogaster broomeanus]
MDHYGLDSSELFWSKRYNFFLSKGYTLRVRYSPSWVPSWQGRRGMDALPQLHEDYVNIAHPDALDATSRDGTVVFLKKIYSDEHPSEEEIALYFSSEKLRKDPANHCVPVIDHFEDEEEPNIHYIVMPLLRPCLDPETRSLGSYEASGIKFMHDNNDCVAQNIMMDAQYLCPDGWHPIHYQDHVDFTGNLHYKKRRQTLLITGAEGRAKMARTVGPQTLRSVQIDIYIVGHMFETEFLSKYEGLENLLPLIRHMTTRLPDERPNARPLKVVRNDLQHLCDRLLLFF